MRKFVIEGREVSEEELQQIIADYLNPNALHFDRIKIVLNFAEGKKILDVGCGIGNTSFIFSNRFKEIYGIDNIQSNIEIAKTMFRKPNLNFLLMDTHELSFQDNLFDCVFLLEVIEHLENPIHCLKEIYRVLKPKMSLIISTPNAVSWSEIKRHFFANKRRITRIFKSIERENRGTGTDKDHIFIWDIFTIFRMLNRVGFRYVSHAFVRPKFPILSRLKPLEGFQEIVIIKVRK
jgi:SAM-dependent methyltransferase